jgi:peptide/nickel transport system substrate-binding protein
VDYRILGPLEVCQDGRVLALAGDRQRALLAVLLLHPNAPVSADELIDALWGERPPRSASNALRVHVSRLRTAFEDGGERSEVRSNGVLSTRGHGYVLRVEPGELDVDRFCDLVELGRKALADSDAEEAARLLRSALALWRGPPLADFTYEPFAQAAIARLEELRVAALEERIEADMALGRHPELVAELAELVEQNPLRERLRGQLMLALYRSGRQAEALEVYQEFRRGLSEQLGLDPGPALRQLELAILGRDPSLEVRASSATQRRPADASTRPAGAPPAHRRGLRLAVGSSTALAVALVAALVALSAGGSASPTVIGADSVGAVTPSGGRISVVVPLSTAPSAVAAGAGSVWVASYNAGTISQIDATTRAVVETIPVGSTPSGIAFGADALWVVNNYAETVSRIDPAVDRVVQTIRVGNGPSGVAVGDGSVWVSGTSDGTLTRINAVTGSVTDTIALGGSPTGVAAGLGAVWVSDAAGDRVLRVNPTTDQITAAINVGSGPTAITVGNGSVWVTNSLDGTVSRVDPRSNQVAATIPTGTGANAIASGRGAVWVANQYAGSLSRIDPTTDAVSRTDIVGNRPAGVALAGGMVWVGGQAQPTEHRGGTLHVLVSYPPGPPDPVQAIDSLGLLSLTNDGLTALKRIGGSDSVQIVPDLAVSLPTPTDAGTTYTFQLRPGVRYSNGESVRPEDFRRMMVRDLTLGPNTYYGGYVADVVGGAACTAHPSHCNLSRGVVTDDAADTVTFHLVAPDPDFLGRLTLADAIAVPAGTPDRYIGDHPLSATGAYEIASYTQHEVRLARNPYFHVWSQAARPDGYPNQIVFRYGNTPSAELTAVERGLADYSYDGVPGSRLGEVQTRYPAQLYINPNLLTVALFLNTRAPPFNDLRVRRALNYAVDRAKVVRLLGGISRPSCQTLQPGVLGYQRYCPYTINPSPNGTWTAPDLTKAQQLITASHTRGTPITIWNLGTYQGDSNAVSRYLASVLDRLGYPTHYLDYAPDPSALGRFANSKDRVQAGLAFLTPVYPSPSEDMQVVFQCNYFIPNSPGNGNFSEFCDHRLDAKMNQALEAQQSNSADAAALWAQADRIVTNDAPFVALTIPSNIDFIAKQVGNYQYSFAQGVLLDQLWVR